MIKSIVLLTALATTPAYAEGEYRMVFGLGALTASRAADADKLGHYGAGMFISGGVQKLGGSKLTGCLVGTGVGILKELTDHIGDPEDALITALGSCLYFEWVF